MKQSVVIPAYNEEENIFAVVSEVFAYFKDPEIIVVNDASTDKTLFELSKFTPLVNLKILTNEVNRGHGYSVIRGLREATGDYILYIDADRQIDLENIKQFYKSDLDFGSGYRVDRHDKPFRKVISFCLKMTNLIFHRIYIKDANCPFKLYRREALRPLLSEIPETYIVPIACLEVMARKKGLKTKVVPVLHHAYHTERKGFLQTMNLKALRFFKDAFFEIIKV